MRSLTARQALTPDECDRVRALVDAVPAHGGATEHAAAGVARRRGTVRIVPSRGAEWLYERIWTLMLRANEREWRFDLKGLEPMQVSTYGEAEQGEYPWHADVGDRPPTALRKLSASVQLTDASAYAGGDLELLLGNHTPELCTRERGAIVVFPAYVVHRVRPVVRGSRDALVAWARGAEPYR